MATSFCFNWNYVSFLKHLTHWIFEFLLKHILILKRFSLFLGWGNSLLNYTGSMLPCKLFFFPIQEKTCTIHIEIAKWGHIYFAHERISSLLRHVVYVFIHIYTNDLNLVWWILTMLKNWGRPWPFRVLFQA